MSPKRLDSTVILEVEGISRMYLKHSRAPLTEEGETVADFLRFDRGCQFTSSVLMDPIIKAFIPEMEQLAEQGSIP